MITKSLENLELLFGHSKKNNNGNWYYMDYLAIQMERYKLVKIIKQYRWQEWIL